VCSSDLASEGDETVLTIAGARLPARPLEPVQVASADGRLFALRIEAATIELWGGLVAQPDPDWLTAPGELLWPGATLYVRLRNPLPDGPGGTLPAEGEQDPSAQAAAGPVIVADRVRIAAAPTSDRAVVADASAWATVVNSDPIALVGSVDAPGVNLLGVDGAITTIWPEGAAAAWLDGTTEAGLIIPLRTPRYGRDGFIWARTDGQGLRVTAQPYYTISGIAGDAYIGLWWVERPMVASGRWQLWQWDPQTQSIMLRLEAGEDFFSGAAPQINPALTPRLLAVIPAATGDATRVTAWVDSADSRTLASNQGVFAFTLSAQASTLEAQGGTRFGVDGAPRVILEPGEYLQPLALSPNRELLAFSQYDEDVASLTAGQIRPANRIRVLNLSASTLRTVYQSESELEFIAPLLTWQDNNTLLSARSRFAAGGTAPDLFGAVWIETGGGEGADGNTGPSVFTVTIPADQTLVDMIGCRNEDRALLALLNTDRSMEYAGWSGSEPVRNPFTVPNNLTRAFLCWRVPSP